MAIYTFYPGKDDGTSSTFEAYDLPSDECARNRAELILQEHQSCTRVAIWAGERKVASIAAHPQGDTASQSSRQTVGGQGTGRR